MKARYQRRGEDHAIPLFNCDVFNVLEKSLSAPMNVSHFSFSSLETAEMIQSPTLRSRTYTTSESDITKLQHTASTSWHFILTPQDEVKLPPALEQL